MVDYFSLSQFRCILQFGSVQSLSSIRLFATLWTAARQASLSIQLPKLAQTHVHWVRDAIQPSHPLSSPSPPAFNLSQHQTLSQWESSLHQVAKVLELQASVLPKNIQDWFPLGLTGLISLQSKGLSRVFSNDVFLTPEKELLQANSSFLC